jgi:hypothetical protein
MDLHNLCFSIWYRYATERQKSNMYVYSNSTALLMYLHSFIDTFFFKTSTIFINSLNNYPIISSSGNA